MSSQQKRGFRLPWAVERGTDEGAVATTLEADAVASTTSDQIEDGVGGELGEGPFHFADAPTPDASTDVSPEASDVPETTAEAAMIDADTATTEPADASPTAADNEAWPTTDQRLTATNETDTAPEEAPAAPDPTPPAAPSPVHVEGAVRATRANPLVAGLVKAMREAAHASRAETTTQLQSEATARVEGIREAATAQTAELRKRADDDIAGIREWSKAEIARIKQETDERIERRKSELSDQTEKHSADVERLVEQVQSTVTAFEADMDSFFERLLAENDPARLASLAEQAPEPPDLSAELTPTFDAPDATGAAEWEGARRGSPGLGADAAAAAEAAATEGLDLHTTDEWPASVLAGAHRSPADAADFEAAGVANTRLHVNGLTSVAGISAFKGALGQLPGIRSVSVSSGEPGVFIFTAVHNPDADLQAEISGLTAFAARVTEVSDDGLTVAAQEPAA